MPFLVVGDFRAEYFAGIKFAFVFLLYYKCWPTVRLLHWTVPHWRTLELWFHSVRLLSTSVQRPMLQAELDGFGGIQVERVLLGTPKGHT